MILKTIYDINALQIIKSFVSESAKYYGADEKESFDLTLATEEAVSHIIENYPPNRNDIFEISSNYDDIFFRVIFNNKGLPVDKDHVPEYDLKNPNNTIDGLKFFLMKKLTDNFYFENKGNLGWQTVIEKKLKSPKQIIKEDVDLEYIKREKLNIELATPDDAYGITKLAYYTYSYSYAKNIFYYPDLLAEEINNENIISYIAKNTQNEIIAHVAIIKSKYSSDIAESSAMMVAPKYRKSIAILKLLNVNHKDLTDMVFGFKMFCGNMVTAHEKAQRVVTPYGLRPFAFKFSIHPSTELIAIDKDTTQRDTNLYCLSVLDKNINKVKIFLPEKHKNISKKMLDNIDFPADISSESYSYEELNSEIKINRTKNDLLSEIYVKQFGKDLYNKLRKTIKDLSAEGYRTIHLKVPAFNPLPETIEYELNGLEFFFSGIIAESVNDWYILYTLLINQKFNFGKVIAYSDIAKELLNYVENESVLSGY